jgi:hypothetical protein
MRNPLLWTILLKVYPKYAASTLPAKRACDTTELSPNARS